VFENDALASKTCAYLKLRGRKIKENEESYTFLLHHSAPTNKAIISKRLRWTGNVTRMG
jgi:hypothetical protein